MKISIKIEVEIDDNDISFLEKYKKNRFNFLMSRNELDKKIAIDLCNKGLLIPDSLGYYNLSKLGEKIVEQLDNIKRDIKINKLLK